MMLQSAANASKQAAKKPDREFVVQIDYFGTPLRVEFDWDAGERETDVCPGSDGSLSEGEIYAADSNIDIWGLLGDTDLTQIYDMAAKQAGLQ